MSELSNGHATPGGPAWDAACREQNWLVYELRAKDGKLAKLPANSDGGGAPIDVHVAARLTFAEAQAAAEELGPMYGIGYLPRAGSALVGIDLDKVISGGTVEPWAERLLKLCPSWAERSPSGNGIRIIGARKFSAAPEITSERNGVGLYASGSRFFTFTGDLIEGRKESVCSIGAVVKETLERLNGAAHPAADLLSSKPEPDTDVSHWFHQLSEDRQVEEVDKMLACLTDPSFGEYDAWLRISFAVYDALGSSRGYGPWDDWSEQLPGYDSLENLKKWNSFGTGRPDKVTIGTLIMLAREHGYEMPHIPMDPEIAERFAALAARFTAGSENQTRRAEWHEGMDMDTLMDASFPTPRWALSDLIPEGLSVFAGKQKSGKSWFCLSLAHAVAEQGEFLGKQGKGGDVLLLALEDTPRRLQDRVRKMGLGRSRRVFIYTSWPTGKAGLTKLLEWIEQARNPLLIVIDTLRRFTGPSPSRENSYERDVSLFAPLQKAAALANVAVVGVTHMRKDTRQLDHWQDAITGSAGLPSVADAVLLLSRGDSGAILRATGRDLAEVELPLSFDPKSCTWRTAAETLAVMLARMEGNEAERRILDVLGKAKDPMSVKDIADELGRTVRAVRHMLQKLRGKGAARQCGNGKEPLWTL